LRLSHRDLNVLSGDYVVDIVAYDATGRVIAWEIKRLRLE
jgi:hypothetical protein